MLPQDAVNSPAVACNLKLIHSIKNIVRPVRSRFTAPGPFMDTTNKVQSFYYLWRRVRNAPVAHCSLRRHSITAKAMHNAF